MTSDPAGIDGSAAPKLAVVAGAVLWGTTGTARALADTGAGPAAVGAVRLLVGAVALLAVARHRGWLPSRHGPEGAPTPGAPDEQPRRSRPRRSPATGAPDEPRRSRPRRSPATVAPDEQAGRSGPRWPVVPVAGAGVAQAVYGPAFFAGVERTGVAVGTVVGIGAAPVVGGLLGWAWRGERPSLRWAAATAIALAGMAVLATGAGDVAIDPVGLALAVTAGVAYAVFVSCTRQLVEDHHPVAVMAVTFTVAAVLLLPAAVAGGRPLLSWPGLLLAVHLGLVTVVIAYLLFAAGLAHLEVGTIATLTLAEPAAAAVLGVVVLDERVGAATAIGVGLIAAGLIVVAAPGWHRRRPRRVEVPFPQEVP